MNPIIDNVINKIKQTKDCIVITSNQIKYKLIEILSNDLVKVTFKSFKEFKEDIFGKIDYFVLSNNYHEDTKLEILKIKLDNSMLIQEDDKSDTIHELYMLKLKNGFDINHKMLNYYNHHQVYIFKYDSSDDLVNQGLALLENKEYIDIETRHFFHQHYNFDNFQDEIFYVVNEISKLLKSGVKPEKIIINKVSEEYKNKFQEAFMLYHIDYEFNESIALYELEETKQILRLIFSNINGKFNDIFSNYLESIKYPSNVLAQIVKALNVLSYFDFDMSNQTLRNLITYILKNTYYTSNVKTNVITFENVFSNIYSDDTYIFIPNFNQDIIPVTHKNNKYLNDEYRSKHNLLTSTEYNKNSRIQVIKFINSNKQVTLTSSNRTVKTAFVRNVLLDDEQLSKYIKEEKKTLEYNDIKSRNYAFLRFLKAKDLYNTYHEITNDFILGYKTFGELSKNKYNNQFVKFSQSFQLDPLVLSYSTIDDYARCPFYYYTKHILKITGKKEQLKDNISILVGVIFHYVLEQLIKKEYIEKDIPILNYNEEINNLINEYIASTEIEVTPKLSFYLKKLQVMLLQIYERIDNHLKNSKFEVFDVERKFEVRLDKDTILKGVIDKILKYENNYIVIDYKTKNVSLDWLNLDKALEMQLPIYLLFIKDMDPNANIAGAYLQSILKNSPLVYKDNKTYQKLFNEATTYTGFTNTDSEIIMAIDELYNSENIILGHKPFKKDGNLTNSFMNHAFTSDEFESIIKYTCDKIKDISHLIKKGDFPIKPKKIENYYNSCSYCSMAHLCYRNSIDVEECSENDDFSYMLKGENHEVE